MSSNHSVNVGGAIRALANLGFNPRDLLAEGIDNSLGVHSTHIRIRIDTDKTCYFVDNGPGMIPSQLVKRFTLYEDSKASDACQGRFGIGEDAKHALLTEYKKSTKTMSNGLVPTKTGSATHLPSLSEITLDWPTAVEKNEFHLHAHDASRKSEELWKKEAIDPSKTGTLDLIPLSDGMFKYFTENKAQVIAHFENMYADDLHKGLILELWILETKHKLVAKHLLQDATEDSKTIKQFKEIRVWKKTDGTLRVSFKDSKNKWVYKDGKSHESCDTLEKEGFAFVGPITIDYAYNNNWRKLVDEGGIYYKRNNKIIQQRKVPALSGGDYGRQDLETGARAVVTFSVKFDTLFGLEVNKSHIDKIHPQLEAELNAISHELSNKTWNQIKKVTPTPTTPPAPTGPAPPTPLAPGTKPDTSKGGLDPHLVITPKPKPAATPAGPSHPVTPTPILTMDRNEFVRWVLPQLKQAHPDWVHQKAFGEAGRLWTGYKSSGVLPVIPTTPIQRIPTPEPATKIAIAKNTTDGTVVITDDSKVLCTINYVGQFNVIDSYLKQVLQSVGDARFKEYVLKLATLNNTLLK
jgi:hypothetical protein